jgi:class 3 adenylate cyclase
MAICCASLAIVAILTARASHRGGAWPGIRAMPSAPRDPAATRGDLVPGLAVVVPHRAALAAQDDANPGAATPHHARQEAGQGRRWFAPHFRIGVHVDEATMDSADDYHGRGVHIAARVGAEPRAGEILAGRETLDAAGPDFTPEASRSAALKGVT